MKFLCQSMAVIILVSNLNLFGLTKEQTDTLDPVLEKAQSYEMNYILYELGYIDDCFIPNYYQDAYEEFDEALGTYSDEAIRKYTTANIQVESQYLYYHNFSENVMDGRAELIQVLQIYQGDKETHFIFNRWGWDYDSDMTNPFNEDRMGEYEGFALTFDGERDMFSDDSEWKITRHFEHTIL